MKQSYSLIGKIGIFSLIFVMPSCVLASEYNLTLTLSHVIATDHITFVGLHLAKGTAHVNAFQPQDGYALTLLSPSRQPLFITHFLPPGPELDSNVQSKEVPFSFTIPYLLDASIIQIVDHGNKTVLSIPVPSLEKLADQAIDIAAKAKESNVADLIPPPQTTAVQDKKDVKAPVDHSPKGILLIVGISGAAGLLVLLGVCVAYRRNKQ